MIHWGAIGVLLILAFGLNLPLGAWRKTLRKFSPAWFLGIHASIPVLFLARFELEITYWIIPLEIALVVAGQVAGSRLRGSASMLDQAGEVRVGADS